MKVAVIRSTEACQSYIPRAPTPTGKDSDDESPITVDRLPAIMDPIGQDSTWKNSKPAPAESGYHDWPELRDVIQQGEECPESGIPDDTEASLELMRMRRQAIPGDTVSRITICAQKRNYDLFLRISVDEQDAFWKGVHEVQYWENA
jgi:hypothetical protein